jgi:hypothetical protein
MPPIWESFQAINGSATVCCTTLRGVRWLNLALAEGDWNSAAISVG